MLAGNCCTCIQRAVEYSAVKTMSGLVRSHVTDEQCGKIVKKFLQRDDFDIVSFQLGPMSDKLIGFLGDHKKLRVSVMVDKAVKEHCFFVKSVPSDIPTHADFVISSGVFSKEARIYSTLLRQIKSSIQSNMSGSNHTWAPNSYMRTNDFIVLEDLSVKGFRTVDVRLQPLDYDHVMASLNILAKFHAAGIIYEEKVLKTGSGGVNEESPRTMKNQNLVNADRTLDSVYPGLLHEIIFVETKGPGSEFFDTSVTCLLAVIDELEGYTSKQLEKIKRAIPSQMHKMMALVKPYQSYRNVLSHGDLWSNNILYRYEGDRVVEARLVDFQHCRYGPPAHDVMDLLHLTTIRAFRERHVEEFLAAYYQTLSAELKKHDLDPETILPWQEFWESCEYFREAALITATIWFQIITLPADITDEMLSSSEEVDAYFRFDRSKLVLKAFHSDRIFRERLIEPVVELIERCILRS